MAPIQLNTMRSALASTSSTATRPPRVPPTQLLGSSDVPASGRLQHFGSDSGTRIVDRPFNLDASGPGVGTERSVVRSTADPEPLRRALEEGSRWYRYVHQRLTALSRQAGCDDRPSLETLNAIRSAVNYLLPPSTATPSVLPADDGGVELFWQKGGWDVILEFDRDGGGSVWTRERSTGDHRIGDLEVRREELLDVLRLLSGD